MARDRIVRQDKKDTYINLIYAFLEIVHAIIVTMETTRYGGLGGNHLAAAVVFLVKGNR